MQIQADLMAFLESLGEKGLPGGNIYRLVPIRHRRIGRVARNGNIVFLK